MFPLVALALSQPNGVMGKYMCSNLAGEGMTWLTIGSNGRYRDKHKGCFDESSYTGRYSLKGGVITLHRFRETPLNLRLIVVPWSDKTFLVGPNETPFFCTRYRAGWRGEDLRQDRAFYRDGSLQFEENARLTGAPKVPAPWTSLLKRI